MCLLCKPFTLAKCIQVEWKQACTKADMRLLPCSINLHMA